MSSSSQTQIAIKNMVCPRCIATVERIAKSTGLEPLHINLGEIILKNAPSQQQNQIFAQQLQENGFAILEDERSRQISQIKALIIDRIHHNRFAPELNLSAHLSQQLHTDYSKISKLYSSVEGITIKRFAILQRIEKAKELLVYDELSLTEISETLDYSSSAYFSNIFKQETGMTPSQFRNLRQPPRKSIDAL